MVDALDLSAILRVYQAADPRGGVPYHPARLVYAYCIGRHSSRRIERATYEDYFNAANVTASMRPT